MNHTGIVWSDVFLQHDTGPHHPERAERLQSIHDRLASTGLLTRCRVITPEPVDLSLVERVHAGEYIGRFQEACEQGRHSIDTSDCAICPISFDAARLAAGAVVAAVDQVMAGRCANVFCPVRPPGHHAEYRAAMGFCFFNNIAIGAEYLRVRYGLQRLVILDWDVHHGNGTQHHFEADPDLLFISLHQHPYTLFPGTGFAQETGVGDGVNTTMNIPLMPGSSDDEYREAFDLQVLPAISKFKPEFILVSTGFDAHVCDPLAQINLQTESFAWMTRETRALAESLCGGRLVTVVEGGYHLEALADCTQAHVEALGGKG